MQWLLKNEEQLELQPLLRRSGETAGERVRRRWRGQEVPPRDWQCP